MAASLGKLTVGGNSGEYYLEKVATGRHDYYAGHGEAPGQWSGKGAEHLGLSGEVTPEAFRAVLACHDPVTGERLKRRDNLVVLGFDVTFSAPKSVSALYALGDEEVRAAVVDAHETAVAAGIEHLEDDACVVRLGAQGVDRQPGLGFIVAQFRHRTSRAGDPQLHTHAVMANVVQTGDGRAAAFDGGLTYRHCRAAGAVYDGALRTALTEQLGVVWENRNGQWEVAAVNPELCQLWSKRRHEIQDCLDEWEQTSGRAAQFAALHTRARKEHVADDDSLEQRWADEADGRGLLQRFTRINLQASVDLPQLSDQEIVEHLVGPQGLTEKTSGFGRRDVLVAAERLLGQGNASRQRLNRIADQVLTDDRVLDLLAPVQRNDGELLTVRDGQGRPVRKVCTEVERRYTTVELVNAELDAFAMAEAGKNTGLAVIPPHVVEETIGEYNAANTGKELDADQAAMVRQLASSGDFVDPVEGRAGSGKTTAVKVYAQAAEKAGITVIGVAPAATAGHVLGQGADLDDTGTVHGLLARLEHTGYRLPKNSVIVLDEAGMCDTRTFVSLIRAAEQFGTKVVPLGDDRQVPSVDAGGLFTVFIRRLGAVELTRNHRFTDQRQRQAAERLRAADPNQVEAAVEQYDQLGLLHRFDRVSQAHQAMVDDWLGLTEEGHTVKMIADANRTVDDLNVLARKALVDRGRVTGRGQNYTDRQTGRRIVLAEGDRVRLGRNDARLRQPDGNTAVVRNGMEATVTHASRRGLEVQLDAKHVSTHGPAKLVLPAGYVAADVDYGYAVTCDKAQGVTVDHVLYHPTDRSSSERAYVALSRGRQSNRIYAVNGGAWQEALAGSRAHGLAAEQQPGRSNQTSRAGHAVRRRESGREIVRRGRFERERVDQGCRESGLQQAPGRLAGGGQEPGRAMLM